MEATKTYPSTLARKIEQHLSRFAQGPRAAKSADDLAAFFQTNARKLDPQKPMPQIYTQKRINYEVIDRWLIWIVVLWFVILIGVQIWEAIKR